MNFRFPFYEIQIRKNQVYIINTESWCRETSVSRKAGCLNVIIFFPFWMGNLIIYIKPHEKFISIWTTIVMGITTKIYIYIIYSSTNISQVDIFTIILVNIGAPYRIFFLYLHIFPCHFYLVVIDPFVAIYLAKV